MKVPFFTIRACAVQLFLVFDFAEIFAVIFYLREFLVLSCDLVTAGTQYVKFMFEAETSYNAALRSWKTRKCNLFHV